MRKILVNVKEAIKIVKAKIIVDDNEYRALVKKWRENLIKNLENLLSDLEDSNELSITYINLNKPVRTKNYFNFLKQLEMSVDENVNLEENDFNYYLGEKNDY